MTNVHNFPTLTLRLDDDFDDDLDRDDDDDDDDEFDDDSDEDDVEDEDGDEPETWQVSSRTLPLKADVA